MYWSTFFFNAKWPMIKSSEMFVVKTKVEANEFYGGKQIHSFFYNFVQL